MKDNGGADVTAPSKIESGYSPGGLASQRAAALLAWV